MIKVLFCGAGYGAGNIGDDAILAGLLISCRMHMPKDTLYGALTFNPSFTKTHIKLDSVWSTESDVSNAFKWATHIVFGGASLLAPGSIGYCASLIRLAHERKKPVCMLGVGTSTELTGTLKELLQKDYDSLDMIVLRSETDKKVAVTMGLKEENLKVCADGAFAIDCAGISYAPTDVLGINLVHEELPNKYPYVQTTIALLKSLSSEFKFSFLCGEIRKDMQYDFCLLHKLFELFGGTFSCTYVNYLGLLKRLALCRVVLTMRMHITIFCALIGVPCIPIIREPKTRIMANELGFKYTLLLDIKQTDLKALMSEVLKDPSKAMADVSKIQLLKDRSLRNGLMLRDWVSKAL